MLTGHKTLHYLAAPAGLQAGQRLHLTATVAGGHATVPVRVTALEPADPGSILQPPALLACGRVVEKPKKPPALRKDGTPRRTTPPSTPPKKQEDLYRLHRMAEIGRLFMQADHFTPPASYRVADIAGGAQAALAVEFRLLSPEQDARPLPEMEQDLRHYNHAAKTLLPEAQAAHAYVTKDRKQAKHTGFTSDASMQQAMLFLRSELPTSQRLGERLKRPAQAFKDALHPSPVKPPRSSYGALRHYAEKQHRPDGHGPLAGMDGIDISLGRMAQLLMGMTNCIVVRDPPPVAAAGDGGNYPLPVARRLQAKGKISAGGHGRIVDLPMMVDLAEGDSFMSAGVTDEKARRYGYSTATALRRELGLKKDESVPLYVYPVSLAKTSDLATDPDRYGTLLRDIMSAIHDAFINGKNGQGGSKRSRALLEELVDPDFTHPDRTVQDMRAIFLSMAGTYGPAWLERAYEKIAPYWAMAEASRNRYLSSNGERPVPRDVQARRLYDPQPARAKQPKKPPTPPSPETDPQAHYKIRGEGWQVAGKKATQPVLAPARATLAHHLPQALVEHWQRLGSPETPAPATGDAAAGSAVADAAPAPRKSAQQRLAETEARAAARRMKANRAPAEPPVYNALLPRFASTAEASLHMPRPQLTYPDAEAYLKGEPVPKSDAAPARPDPFGPWRDRIRIDRLARDFDEDFHADKGGRDR